MILFSIWFLALFVLESFGGVSPVHDYKSKIISKGDRFILNSPHNVLKHLDDSISKKTKNVTDNPEMESNLYQISKDLVSAILSRLEIQEKITRITREALEASGKNKGITAIETRRILDYISRTLSGHTLTITKESTEPELHRLVYGLAQIAAEVSIVAALKDTTYATALSKKQSVDLSLRKKRSIIPASQNGLEVTDKPTNIPFTTVYNAIMNKKSLAPAMKTKSISPFSVLSGYEKKPVLILNNIKPAVIATKGFLNQTTLDMDNRTQDDNYTALIILDKSVNASQYVKVEPVPTLAAQEASIPGLTDDWAEPKENIYKPLHPDMIGDIALDQPEFEFEDKDDKRAKQRQEKLEVKAKKAILYAGDVAYLTAASVVAMRRALTASIEVQMSVKYAKTGMSNHQELMMNLAKTAAQQAGKEAKTATSKSLACERVIKQALKYTAQSNGADLNHVANRIVMDSLSLSTLAKSMAFVSSDIAINSLYEATDVKPPT